MRLPQVVLDTNVLIAALLSNRGASHRLLRLVDSGKFQLNLSVPLVLEYEEAAKKRIHEQNLPSHDINAVVDYLCSVGRPRKIYYLWRPVLSDPGDDMVLELAVNGECDVIITFNKSDFVQAKDFGIQILTPQEFLRKIGEKP